MSNQIVISSGAKVRSLEGVLTGTAGIVNSVPLGGANGVATLDSLGKVPLSQLPASVVTYLGTWNAATNTPTLTNGVGDVGDLYICNVAGTVNFGAGPITFAVGDWVIYSGTEWQKSSGASGTVTSVAVTESGDALTITGSPITTSGTINIGFAGTGSQYIKGDGTLATFPTTIDQAKRLITEVYNSTGATLSKGTVVYINGGQGNLPTVTKAQANADNTSAQTYGVVQSDITNNNNGFVVVIGSLTDIDTQAYAVGTQLYLSGTTAGDWTSTKPSAPIHLVYVGIVVRSHPTQGVVEIRIQNGYELEELHDVAISAPVNNQGIFYNSSNDLWENKSIATALGYTPANDALVVHLAGTETITGSKTFNAAITADAGIGLKEGVVPSAVGYTGLAGDADGLLITKKIGTTAYTNLFYFQAIDASNTYTYPNLSGTLALLEGTQTFTGAKTFSSVLTADSSLLLKNGVFAIASGYTNLAGNNLNNGLVVQFYGSGGTAITNNLNFNATTGYNYIFPAANGTIALTSNLSSYVPYTGATADVNLGTTYSLSANNITAAGVVKSDFGLQLKSGLTTTISGYLSISAQKVSTNSQLNVYTDTGFYFSLIAPNNANYSYTFPASSGTIALTSDLSNYVTLTGASQTISSSKTFTTFPTTFRDVVIDGSGTSASGVNLKIASGGLSSSGSGYITLYSSASKNLFVFDGTTTTTAALDFSSITSGITRTFTYPDANGTLVLGTGTTNYITKFTGTSTIGNSIIYDNGTNVGIGTTTPAEILEVFAPAVAGTSQQSRLRITQAGSISARANLVSGVISGENPYFAIETRQSASPFAIVERLRIDGNGNVGIGTSSPSSLLHVSGGALTIQDGTYYSNLYANYTGGVSALTATSALMFVTNSSERMRITSGGVVLIGTTSVNAISGAGSLQVAKEVISSGSSAFLGFQNRASTNFFGWYGNTNAILYNDAVGNIVSINASSGAYTATSDIRLKENINESENALDKLMQVKVKSYDWISNKNHESFGLIAQELYEILPEYTYKPEIEEENWGIAKAELVPMLIKAIQEQQEIINQLSAKVTALENK